MPIRRNLFSIRFKLGAIALAMMGVVCALVLAGSSGMERLSETQRLILGLEEASGALQRTMRGINELVITEGSGTAKQYVRRSLSEFEGALRENLAALRGTPFEEELTGHTLPEVAEFKKQVDELLKYQEGEVTLDSDAPIRTFGRAAKAGDRANQCLKSLHEAVRSHSKDYVGGIRLALLGGAAIAVGAVLVLFTLLYLSIILPIRSIAAFAHRAAKGDFSSEIEMDRLDEIGELADDLKGMSSNLRAALTRLGTASERLSENLDEANAELESSSQEVGDSLSTYEVEIGSVLETSRNLEQVTGEVVGECEKLKLLALQSTSAITLIVASINEVSQLSLDHSNSAGSATEAVSAMLMSLNDITINLQSLSASSIQVASSITEMQANVENVKSRSMDASKASEAVTDCARNRGLLAVASAEKGIVRTHETVEALASVIQRLDSRSKAISNIVNIIEDISSQTSLLALNAAILAAQAGRYGEGFAIVANEIKALADRITTSTHEIELVIRENNAETKASANLSIQGKESAEDGIRLIGEVRSALEEILGHAASSAELSKFLEIAMLEQAGGAAEIAMSTNHIAHQVNMVSAAASELDHGSRMILDEMEKIGRGSTGIMEKALRQKDDSGSILSAGTLVAESADLITGKVTLARESVKNIATILEVLHSTTKNLADSVQNLASRIQQINSQTTTVVNEIDKFSL